MKHKGDQPLNPLTDQSVDDYHYPNMMETVQSHQSFKPQLFKNQDLYEELIRKAEHRKAEQKQITWKTNVHLKLNEEYQELQQKREQLKLNYQQLELQQCSFQPTISNKSKQIGSYFGSSPRYMSPKQIVTQPSSKVQSRRQSNNKENSDNNVWDRLSKCKETQQTIQPQSTRTNQTQRNPQSITNRLYEDAFQPKKFKFKYEEKQSPKSKNMQSEKHLIRHFVKQFYESITNARLWSLEHQNFVKNEFKFEFENDLCLLSIDELAITLDTLGFAPFKTYDYSNQENVVFKIFRLLQCPQDFEFILSRNLLSFLLAMQGFNVDYSLVPKYNNNYNIHFPKKYKNSMLDFDEGNINIPNHESIIKQFNQLYVNQLAYKKKQVIEDDPQVLIRPAPGTAELANKYRARVQSQITESKPLNLNDYDQFYQKKKEQLKQEHIDSIKQYCPFSPKINATHVSPRYHLAQRRQIEQQEEELPSFHPNLNKSQLSHAPEVASPDQREAIKRMVKGRVEKQLNQIIISQGTCYQKKRKNIEQQLYQEEIGKLLQQPIMYVNVALENNLTKRIAIYQGDQPRQLAQNFIKDQRLDQSLVDELTALLEEQLAN